MVKDSLDYDQPATAKPGDEFSKPRLPVVRLGKINAAELD
jgi:hypothetical protein